MPTGASGSKSSLTIADVGERALLAAMREASAAIPGALADDIVIGTGDDAAVLAGSRPTVLTVDTAVQDRHFRLDWSTPKQIGARSVVASAADVAAMGASLSGVLVSIAMPLTTPVDLLLGINEGIIDQTHQLGGRVLGGDLVSASEISLSVTSVGVLDAAPVTLSMARPGDVLALSGPLGGAAAGYAILALGADGLRSGATEFERQAVDDAVRAFVLPHPDLRQGVVAAAAGAHAMTDVSDGLVEELITMSAASAVRLDISSDSVPMPGYLRAVAEMIGESDLARRWALAGGEDHQLLAAFDGAVPPGWTAIGHASSGDGEVFVDGARTDLRGWQSF
ncbi:thiamine-phosphate kinase [Gordonia effusa]|uniref:thiamine-phosphate kinase n=1 Tax=Gordonia effusa TaxID=263908 RepID=UPI001FDEDCBB|nr:thiamine-phosphate kinase [Gordonia effusa]